MPGTQLFRILRWLRQSEWSLLLAIVAAVVITAVVDSNHSYYSRPMESLRDIARNTAMLGIFALGAAVVIIAGGIDLSSGSMIALSGTVCATTMLALAPTDMMAFKPVGGLVVLLVDRRVCRLRLPALKCRIVQLVLHLPLSSCRLLRHLSALR